MLKIPRVLKYRNKPTELDGYRFDSQKEARRYADLKLLERAGEVISLVVHPIYVISVNGQKICNYEADFSYRTKAGRVVVEDVKGVKTDVYKLKKKLMLACYGIEVIEP